jgi:hypothetical protein
MEPRDAKKFALLLQVIADELYIARNDRDFEGASGGGPDLWINRGARDEMIRGIEKMRHDIAASSTL